MCSPHLGEAVLRVGVRDGARGPRGEHAGDGGGPVRVARLLRCEVFRL